MKKPEDDLNPLVNALVKEQLDESLNAIDDPALQRLAAAREQAVLAAQKRAQRPSLVSMASAQVASWHKPMWAMAATVCLAVPTWYAMKDSQLTLTGQEVTSLSGAPKQAAPQASQLAAIDSPLSEQSTNLTTLDIMTNLASLDEEELEILEDLEFALWLQEEGLEGSLNEQGVHQQGALGAQSQSAHG